MTVCLSVPSYLRPFRMCGAEMFKILNAYENIDRTYFSHLRKTVEPRGHISTLVKDQCRLEGSTHSHRQ